MRILCIPFSDSTSTDVEFEHDYVLDPRPNATFPRGYKLSLFVNGRILTITRIDDYEEQGKGCEEDDLYLRAYLPTEVIPDFTSTVYTYWGLDHEYAPRDTTKVIFHPSVTTIQDRAFMHCEYLVRIQISDHITRIDQNAFYSCVSLKSIRLSKNLEYIGQQAFRGCESLQAVFLPPTVTHIGGQAFRCCQSLRFCILPEPIDHLFGLHLSDLVFYRCDRLLTTVNYEFVDEDEWDLETINNYQWNQWVMQRYAKLPFHQACSSTSINPQVILNGIEHATEVDDQQMTALHILCANPHVTEDCIRAYLQLTPEAAEQEDDDGMTPFQYLCRNDITLFDDRNFSSKMALWYGCMPPQTETGGNKRKRR
jgi:hypothetical protein